MLVIVSGSVPFSPTRTVPMLIGDVCWITGCAGGVGVGGVGVGGVGVGGVGVGVGGTITPSIVTVCGASAPE